MSNPALIEMLAASLLAGEATPEQVFARASHTLGREWPWLRTLAQRFVKAIAGRTRPRPPRRSEFPSPGPGISIRVLKASGRTGREALAA